MVRWQKLCDFWRKFRKPGRSPPGNMHGLHLPEIYKETVVMHCLVRSLALVTLILVALVAPEAPAQGQNSGPGVGFRNDTTTPVIVQGVSVVNNMLRRGQPILINAGKTVWDNNLPMGVRYYTIYDANQTSRILLQNQLVRVQTTDQLYSIRTAPNAQVKLQQEAVPSPSEKQ